jgi:UDP-sugar transporter A1/2/3
MHYSRISVAPSQAYSAATAVLLNELLKGSISVVIALKRIDDDMTLNPPRPLTGSSSNMHLDPLLSGREKGDGDLRPSYMPSHSSSSQSAYAGVPTNLSSSRSPSSSLASYLLSLTRKDWRPRLARLKAELFSPDCWKLSIPAILYVIQNNLQYVAASNLDVATFQVTYQMKILTTAGFSVLMLGKKLSTNKWLALLGLAVGVGIVQIQSSSAATPSSSSSSPSSSHDSMNPFKGFSAVSAACFTSGLAGVYFEKVLKGSQADLWIRNVQLSLFSLLPAILPVLLSPPSPHHPYPSSLLGWLASPFHDFNFWAWMTVAVQVFGGLVTAIVIKYSDNILKGFATSLSIVISFLASVGFFGYRITPGFVIGSTTVLAATWMYNQPGPETEGGGAKGKRGDGKDRRIPGSPVPSDAPIIGDFRCVSPSFSFTPSIVTLTLKLTSPSSYLIPLLLSKHTPNSASNSMVNIASLLTSKFPSTSLGHSQNANGVSNPDYGYHVNEHGLTASNNASGFYTPGGSRPPSRPPSRGPPASAAGLSVQTS